MLALALALAECAGRKADDAHAQLAAAMMLATWTVAFVEAHRTFKAKQQPPKASAAFLAIVDRGIVGGKAAMAGTPYA